MATAAQLRKSQLQKPDKVPKNYDWREFHLHGKMDLDIAFDGLAMNTPVYIKLDASEPLLLPEGVCRQLRIISYHPDVTDKRGWSPGEEVTPSPKKERSVVMDTDYKEEEQATDSESQCPVKQKKEEKEMKPLQEEHVEDSDRHKEEAGEVDGKQSELRQDWRHNKLWCRRSWQCEQD